MPLSDNPDDKEEDMTEGLTILPMLPLRDIIIFPHMVVPLFVGRERSINALDEAMNKDKQLFLAAQKDAKIQDPDEKDVYPVGTIGSVTVVGEPGSMMANADKDAASPQIMFAPVSREAVISIHPGIPSS